MFKRIQNLKIKWWLGDRKPKVLSLLLFTAPFLKRILCVSFPYHHGSSLQHFLFHLFQPLWGLVTGTLWVRRCFAWGNFRGVQLILAGSHSLICNQQSQCCMAAQTEPLVPWLMGKPGGSLFYDSHLTW